MDKKLKILKMKDKSDKFEVDKGILWDIPFRLLLVMRTGGGKSNFIANMFRDDFYGKDFKGENIILVSPLTNDNKMLGLIEMKNIPDDNIMTEFDNDIIKSMYDMRVEEFAECVENGKKPPNIVWIFDDVSWSGNLRKGNGGFNTINLIFCNGRKHNQSIILTSQFYNHLLPSCRSQANGLVIGNTSDKQLKHIAEENNYMDSDKIFKQKFRENVVEKHDYIIINYTNKRKDMYLNKDFEPIT
tara:strand:+ start:4819 stop:5547 length:729 start_codon:yes stop_codon:yes gene_type:complete